MKILELSSTLETFRPIKFKENGFTFILGEGNAKKETFNGTGKTLSISLIDFCLGSNEKKFLKALDCEIILKVKINDQLFIIRRDTKNQKKIFVNNEEYNLDNFKKFLCSINEIDTDNGDISLREILHHLIKYKDEDFVNKKSDKQGYDKAESLIALFYLLDIDTKLMVAKKNNKSELGEIDKIIKVLNKEEIIQSLITSNIGFEAQKSKLKSRIQELESKIKEMKISEEISSIRENRDILSENLNKIDNELNINKMYLRKITSSLKNDMYYKEEDLIKKYQQYKSIFGDTIQKELADVLEFHRELLEKRYKRLKEAKDEITKKINELNIKRSNIQHNLDLNYKPLLESENGEELKNIYGEIGRLEAEIQTIDKYVSAINTQNNKKNLIKKEMADANVETNSYLEKINSKILDMNSTLIKYASMLYPNPGINLMITNNINENKTRYNISYVMSDNTSDGVKIYKLICLDMLVKHINKTNLDFLIYDNKIFNGIDYEKIGNLYKHLHNSGFNFQFISTISTSDYEQLKSKMNEEDFKNIIQDNIVISLGKNDSDRLLGIQIELGED